MNLPSKLPSLLMFYAGFLGIFICAYLAVGSAQDLPVWLGIAGKAVAAILAVGAVLCWRCGWIRFKKECQKKGPLAFIVYVWLAPFSLPFSIK